MATSRTDSLYLFAAHVNTSSACACVCACVRVGVYALLNLFLETAAAESIIYSAGIDIPRMLSSISDPSGENIAVPKRPMHARTHARTHMHARKWHSTVFIQKGEMRSAGTGSALTQSSGGHLSL